MAKKALIEKQQKKPKFKVRQRNRCRVCGRPRGFMRKFQLCRRDRKGLEESLHVSEPQPDEADTPLLDRR